MKDGTKGWVVPLVLDKYKEVIMSFKEWLDEFVKYLIQSGIPEPQAKRYYGIYKEEALKYFNDGVTPGDAVTMEIL